MVREHGFTLIELLIVVAIIGILASLAVSAYQTYTVRTQVTEAINFAGFAKTPITKFYSRTGSPPTNRVDAGLSADPADSSGDYVSQLQVVNGRVDIVFGHQAHPAITNKTLSLTPYITTDGVIVWRCGRAQLPEGQLLGQGDGNPTVYQPGNIDDRYLPSSCR